MKRLILAIILMFALGGGALALTEHHPAPITQAPIKAPKKYTAKDWLKEINRYRKKYGVAPLTLDKRLNKSAQKKADKNAKEEDLDNDPHTDDKGVIDGLDFIEAADPECTYIAENIAPYFHTPNKTIKLWMQSPEHKAAILDPRYVTTGFGWNKIEAVEHFCALEQESAVQPTARCRDGSYSYSQHHQGTCSWHGGVSVWYR